MRILRKINKGFVLTIIVLVILIVYLVKIETKRNSEKPNIETAVKEYIELVDKYAVLPKENQKIYSQTLSTEEKEKEEKEAEKVASEHLEKYKEELKKKMIDNEKAIDIQKLDLENLIKSGNNFEQSVLTKFDRRITKIKKYVFDDDQVTVTFDSNVEIETKHIEDGEEKTSSKLEKNEDESITLKLEGDTWKVVYAYLENHFMNNDGFYGNFMSQGQMINY